MSQASYNLVSKHLHGVTQENEENLVLFSCLLSVWLYGVVLRWRDSITVISHKFCGCKYIRWSQFFHFITGRLMVGLRWWNHVDDNGESHWVFEARKVGVIIYYIQGIFLGWEHCCLSVDVFDALNCVMSCGPFSRATNRTGLTNMKHKSSGWL